MQFYPQEHCEHPVPRTGFWDSVLKYFKVKNYFKVNVRSRPSNWHISKNLLKKIKPIQNQDSCWINETPCRRTTCYGKHSAELFPGLFWSLHVMFVNQLLLRVVLRTVLKYCSLVLPMNCSKTCSQTFINQAMQTCSKHLSRTCLGDTLKHILHLCLLSSKPYIS